MYNVFKNLLLLLCFFLWLSLHTFSYAADTSKLEETLQNYELPYPKYIYKDNSLSIDLTPLNNLLQENFSDIPLSYEWDIYGQSREQWLKLETNFDSLGEKDIELSIYSQEEGEKTLIYRTEISTFVYEKSVPLIASAEVSLSEIEDYILAAEEIWVYVKLIGKYDEEEIPGKDILDALQDYKISFPENSNYFVLWWEKEFLFSALSNLHIQSSQGELLNFVIISGYNPSVLRNYISNSIAGTDFIGRAFIIDESLKFQIIKNPVNIIDLEKEVSDNSYSYTSISQGSSISPIFFISQFVNSLSHTWISSSNIYIILLLPIFLTCVGFSKHMIGISSLGTVIPVFLTILYIKIGIIFTLILVWFLLILNIFLAKFVWKYTLLYTPKVSFITIINLLVFMLFYQSLSYFELIYVPIDDILYVALFFIMAEKLITIITSKEFREYKKHIFGTIIISMFCLMLYNIDSLRVFLMAYPEILLIFVPLNFIIWRFTGLRITEYLRFREIVKSIEE